MHLLDFKKTIQGYIYVISYIRILKRPYIGKVI